MSYETDPNYTSRALNAALKYTDEASHEENRATQLTMAFLAGAIYQVKDIRKNGDPADGKETT